MTGDRFCITVDREWWEGVPRADRPAPCYRRGIRDGARVPTAHYASCDENSECRGCVPRGAVHGTMLCGVCLWKFKDALGRLGWLIAHLRSIERTGAAVGERVHTSMDMSILLPDSWDAADELMVALGAPKFRATDSIDDAIAKAHGVVAEWQGDLDARLNTAEGASQAVVTVRRMQRALARYKDAEVERRPIPEVLCPKCRKRELYRHAPLQYLDDIFVMCNADGCDYRLPWFSEGPAGKDGEPDPHHPDYVRGWVDIYAPIFEGIQKDMARRARDEARTA